MKPREIEHGMIPVVTPSHMQQIDASSDVPLDQLVDRAGAAVARAALGLLGGAYGRRVLVICGPGNNGADGRVAAERLVERGVRCRVVDALELPARLPTVDLVIDAAFGTGFRGGWRFPDVGDTPVLAVDVPTGLDAGTGVVAAATPVARHTVTFQAAKPGHFLGAGPAHCGSLEVADIGLDVDAPDARVVDAAAVRRWIPQRATDAHKWREAVRIVAGSPGMTGAAYLATAAAQRAGASLVALSSPGVDADHPVEAIERRVPAVDWDGTVLDDLHRFRSLVIGPGLGREEYTVASVLRCIDEAVVPIVIDGDALFALSWNEDGTPARLLEREVPTVLTPHDGEYGLLTGHPPDDDRIAAATQLVEATGATVLLKGPVTVVASPGEVPLIVDSGDERLATAGTGDVLAGIIGALLARRVPAHRAAAAGAYVHGLAVRRCAATGVIAGDLIEHLPAVLTDLLDDSEPAEPA
ncbi:MAG: NAD(P)H-hydrate dehydratase [Acidimicrobiaceae bacterium]|nr:NAD(P)H-hydrate dehydratase [Acidimicrobiaceae bacterium]